MSARDQIAAMLNQLMGPTRNNDVDRSALNYKDEEMCKFFLVSFCPHELFTNTKADMGPCPYLHDENVRIAYRESRDFERLGYERDFYRFLCKMHDDIQRKIAKNKERLTITQGGNIGVNNRGEMDETLRAQLSAKVQELEKEIAELLSEAERAGEVGQLEESQQLVEKIEKLKLEVERTKAALEATDQQERLQKLAAVGPPPSHNSDPSQAKPMEVCETCGCFLIIGDVQSRIDEHFNGKQHNGSAKITETMRLLDKRLHDMSRRERSRSRSSDRSSRRRRSRDRGSHSSSHKDRGGRERRHRHRSRSKSRSRDSSDESNGGRRHGHKRSHRRERSSSRDRDHHRKRRH